MWSESRLIADKIGQKMIKQTINYNRHHIQGKMREQYLKDKRVNKVPNNFPGVLRVNDNFKDYDLEKVLDTGVLNTGYRKYTTENKVPEEFKYFYENLLCHISKKRTRFKRNKSLLLLSQIYTVSDEALGLLVLHNKLDTWNRQLVLMEQGKKGRELRLEKRYCDHSQGTDWSDKGKMMYQALKYLVRDAQNTDISKSMEKEIQS